MPILRPIGHEEHQPGGWKALDETLEDGLRLAVDPLEVLDHDEQGLNPTLADQKAGDALQRASATLRWIQPVPRRIVDGNVEQREERGERRPERVIERLQRVHHPLAPQFDVCPLLDPEISLE